MINNEKFMWHNFTIISHFDGLLWVWKELILFLIPNGWLTWPQKFEGCVLHFVSFFQIKVNKKLIEKAIEFPDSGISKVYKWNTCVKEKI